jgi:hypothetical protein
VGRSFKNWALPHEGLSAAIWTGTDWCVTEVIDLDVASGQ